MEPRWTEKDREVFEAYTKDAVNWSGIPLVGGNVGGSKEERGNLTHLKRLGLIKTFKDEGCIWIIYTDKGKEVAKDVFGIDIASMLR